MAAVGEAGEGGGVQCSASLQPLRRASDERRRPTRAIREGHPGRPWRRTLRAFHIVRECEHIRTGERGLRVPREAYESWKLARTVPAGRDTPEGRAARARTNDGAMPLKWPRNALAKPGSSKEESRIRPIVPRTASRLPKPRT